MVDKFTKTCSTRRWTTGLKLHRNQPFHLTVAFFQALSLLNNFGPIKTRLVPANNDCKISINMRVKYPPKWQYYPRSFQ